jgi:hypothetical protein
MSDENLSKVRRVDKRYVELLIRAEKDISITQINFTYMLMG